MENNIEASSSAHFSARPNEQSDTTRPRDASNVQHCTFTAFENMPYELQNMVWTIAACEPRVVELHGYTKHFRQSGRKKAEIRFLSATLVPAILHTCSGARRAGLKLYDRLYFSSRFTGSYVNWAVDYIKFGPKLYPSLQMYPSLRARDDRNLSEIYQKCRRLIIREYEFEAWGLKMRFQNVEEIVLLSGDIGSPPWIGSGSLTLVPIEPISPQAPSRSIAHQVENMREQQFKTLMKVDDLEKFSRSIITGLATSRTSHYQWFSHFDLQNVVPAFRRVRAACKKLDSIRVMHAIRGREEGMTREQKAERKKREKVEAQKNYRVAHPEIPWHEHGFQGNCPCVECNPRQGQSI